MGAKRWGNATAAAVEAAKKNQPGENGNALDSRQRKTRKAEIIALVKAINTPEADAIRKLAGLIE